MGIRTGKPRGRPRGAKNKRTKERMVEMEQAAAAIGDAIPEAFEGDAHALLVAVYKDQRLPIAVRLDAAKAAIPYEKPKLAPSEGKAEPTELPLHERLALYAREDVIEASAGKVVKMRRK